VKEYTHEMYLAMLHLNKQNNHQTKVVFDTNSRYEVILNVTAKFNEYIFVLANGQFERIDKPVKVTNKEMNVVLVCFYHFNFKIGSIGNRLRYLLNVTF